MGLYVSEIQRFCVHDGPGIRDTVFLQGCLLDCKWCQNPETLSPKPVLLFDQGKCTGCGACLEPGICTKKAISYVKDKGVHTDKKLCVGCGDCCDVCYFLARKMSSKKMSTKELVLSILKNEVVYQNSGGGVTVSGGEPLWQSTQVAKFLKECKSKKIHTAMETAGFALWSDLDKVIDVVDVFLYDMKFFTDSMHVEWTGVSNIQILKNLRRLSEVHNNIVIRIPLIPKLNDTDEEFGKMIKWVKDLKVANTIHILPFHHFGVHKYHLLEKKYWMENYPEENKERISACVEIATSLGFQVSVGGAGVMEDRSKKEEIMLTESFMYE
ncbi:MAG: glycyl-radical enzyme activating protein [Lachnospiraceae bacterium]|nr:glycyl-radical enzyme activating protein [Lachnospiraceae bacterium]